MPSIALNKSTSICALKDFLAVNKDLELYTKSTKDGVLIKTGAKKSFFKEKIDARRARTRRALIRFVSAKNPSVVARQFKSFLAGDEETLTQPLNGRQILFALAESQYTPLINSINEDRQEIAHTEGMRVLKKDLDAVGWRLHNAKPSTFFTEMSLWASDHVKAPVLPPPPFQDNASKFNLALNYAKHSAIKDTLFSSDAAQYQTLENETRKFIDQYLVTADEALHDLFKNSGMVSSAALRETLNSPNTLIRNIEMAAKDLIKHIEDIPKSEKGYQEGLVKISLLARDIRVSNEKMLKRVEFGARLFTDENYLCLYSESQRPVLRAIGQSMAEIAKELKNDSEAFQSLLGIASAAEHTAEPLLDQLSKLKRTGPGRRENWVNTQNHRKHRIFEKQAKHADPVNIFI